MYNLNLCSNKRLLFIFRTDEHIYKLTPSHQHKGKQHKKWQMSMTYELFVGHYLKFYL
jgi:hypothetical protein